MAKAKMKELLHQRRGDSIVRMGIIVAYEYRPFRERDRHSRKPPNTGTHQVADELGSDEGLTNSADSYIG
jgi:hypothetical protein